MLIVLLRHDNMFVFAKCNEQKNHFSNLKKMNNNNKFQVLLAVHG